MKYKRTSIADSLVPYGAEGGSRIVWGERWILSQCVVPAISFSWNVEYDSQAREKKYLEASNEKN
jgi:hypothetical protein